MSGTLERGLAVLELLSGHPEGMEFKAIARQCGFPASATHRLLTELLRLGYVRQKRDLGDYVLSTKMAALGMGFLGETGLIDLAQPLVDRLAAKAGDLVRLGLADDEHITWVVHAQGAAWGLKYDPDRGSRIPLANTVSGHAYLSTLPDAQVQAIVQRHGVGQSGFGPGAPSTEAQVIAAVRAARQTGVAMGCQVFAQGLAALSAPIVRKGEACIGVLTIAGPLQRLSEERMQSLVPDLLATAADLAQVSRASPLFR
jgi:IclR family transcriptional regulator, acetate operon repressor